MKTSIKFILSFIILALIGCKSNKVSSNNATINSIELLEAYAKPWVAGIKDGGSGIEYTFIIKIGEIRKISFDSVWVNGQRLKSKVVRDSKLLPDHGMIVSGNKIKLRCSGEKTAVKEVLPPKQLENDQALFSYQLDGNSIQYFLVEKIEIKKGENRQ